MKPATERAPLRAARRVIVKIGTRLLVHEDGRIDEARIEALVDQIARIHDRGIEVVVVSSGAIGAGIDVLSLPGRPVALPELQMTAAVGQTRLLQSYASLFSERSIIIGQVLLTHDDLKNRKRHLNARQTMLTLLQRRVVPVVNENDVVSVDEIKLGDNDELAALVGILVEADLLVLLTSAPGLLGPDGQRVPVVPAIGPEQRAWVFDKESALSTGGMHTKLDAADLMCQIGAHAVIANGNEPDILARICAGEDLGTMFGSGAATAHHTRRKKWIAYFQRVEGTVEIDDGAVAAIRTGGRSLLPIGVTRIDGNFGFGAMVEVVDSEGLRIAQGFSTFSSGELEKIKGCRTDDISTLLDRKGSGESSEVIHRDDLVLVQSA